MKRRQFLFGAGVVALWPRTVFGQTKPARIALLGSGAARSSNIFVDGLKQGLAENGLVEERDYTLDVRWAEGEYERFPALAADVAKQSPQVIIPSTIAAVRAAQRASPATAIVMPGINDPVGAGLIASLARPGENTTGVANLSEDLTPKVLELLRAMMPGASVIAALFNPGNPSNLVMLDRIRAHAGTIGVTVEPTEIKSPSELQRTLEAIVARRPDALLVINDAVIIDLRERIATFALQRRLPTASSLPELTDAGALAGYGPPRVELYRRSAYYVKRILDGVKPADLPVEQPTRIELSVNLKTAKTLAIAIPDSFIARADRVIE